VNLLYQWRSQTFESGGDKDADTEDVEWRDAEGIEGVRYGSPADQGVWGGS